MKSYTLLLAPIVLLLPPPSLAQSLARTSAGAAVVSVQELAMPRKTMDTYKKGITFLIKGDVQASVPYFRSVTELAPTFYGGFHNLALAQYQLGQFDEALDNFQKSIDLTSGSFAPSLFGLSMIFYRRAQFAQAEPLIQRGLLAAPGSAVGKYCLGLVQYALGRIAEAQRSALDTLRLDPANFDVHILLAHIHERLHNPNAVLAEVDAYLRFAPKGELQEDALALRQRAQRGLARFSASNESVH